jgi:hypothetical protein
MPKPYSYDLRQKVSQAIKLDGPKISEAPQLFNARVATPLTYGFQGKPKLGRPSRCPINPKVIVIKLPQGENFRQAS